MSLPRANPSRDAETGHFYLDVDIASDSEGSWSEGSNEDAGRCQGMVWRRALFVGFLGLACVCGLVVLGNSKDAQGAPEADGRAEANSGRSLELDAVTRPTAAPSNAPVLSEANASAWHLRPEHLHTHDGGCASNEELFEGLCYKKCNLLTDGREPFRTSAWSCCKNHPCEVTKVDVGSHVLCSGYDVSGDGSCPRRPGSCLEDEELHLGVCYMKCSILTDGAFPHRVAAATCCKTGGLGCLDVFNNDKTRTDFAVGGGGLDHDPATPSGAHAPLATAGEAEAGADETGHTEEAASASSTTVPYVRPEPAALGNASECGFEEELYGGLCYKKCGLLTYGTHPIRTSSWTCCRSHPCGLTNQRGSVGHKILCNGFDISADGSCPSVPGKASCPEGEEQHLGVCYKKCSILTDGAFPHRVAAATCCKTGGLGCLDVFDNDKTSTAFDVGSASAAKPHSTAAPGTESAAFLVRK